MRDRVNIPVTDSKIKISRVDNPSEGRVSSEDVGLLDNRPKLVMLIVVKNNHSVRAFLHYFEHLLVHATLWL